MCLCFTMQTFFFQSIQNLCYSTQPVSIFQHIINIFITELHIHFRKQEIVFILFYIYFFAIQPQVLIFCPSWSHHFLFIFFFLFVFFALFYNEMVTVDKYIETERVALLQTCSRVWNDQLCPNTEHAFLSICYCHVIIFYIYFSDEFLIRL